MESNDILTSIISAVTFLSRLAVLGICIYYVIKKQSADGILLLISAMLSLLSNPFYLLINRFFSLGNGEGLISGLSLIQFYWLINSVLFTTGFVLLILKYLKQTGGKNQPADY